MSPKPRIIRVGNSLVFLNKTWNCFKYIENARNVISIFDSDLKSPLTQEEYKSKNLLSSFFKKEDFEKEYRYYLARCKYQFFTEKYKITPTSFKKAFNSMMREIWEIKPYYSNFCFNYKGTPNPKKVMILHERLPLLKKASNESITPLIFFTGMSEEELKSVFREDWDTVYNNSKNKNLLISRMIFSYRGFPEVDRVSLAANEFRAEYIKWNKIKSCVLKISFLKIGYYNIKDYDYVYIMSNLFKGKELKNELNNGKYRNMILSIINYSKIKYDINWCKEDWIVAYNHYRAGQQ